MTILYIIGPIILKKNKLTPCPLKLLILQVIWVIPYLLVQSFEKISVQVANYLERSLLPLRTLCYTQADLLSSQPLRNDFDNCVEQFFTFHRHNSSCKLNIPPEVIIRPRIRGDPSRVLVIRTAPKSVDYRNYIRDTWKPTIQNYSPVIFVVGAMGNELLDEANEYGAYLDILQFGFTDSYHNLSWKMMAIYGWVLREIHSADEIIVVNDDTIVNVTAIAEIERPDSEDSWIIGKVSRGYPRLFMPWLPWHIPGSMYPHLCYPRFTQGSSFIVSRGAARDLLARACRVPFIQLDDIFMGILSNCASIDLIHHSGFDKHVFYDFTVYHYQYSRHSADYLRSLWESAPHLHLTK